MNMNYELDFLFIIILVHSFPTEMLLPKKCADFSFVSRRHTHSLSYLFIFFSVCFFAFAAAAASTFFCFVFRSVPFRSARFIIYFDYSQFKVKSGKIFMLT